ncbi:hypothetical protein [Paraburkholderia sacchari]|uniref:hypothetical protein n=1 Tax=Paraburkholderia sacchari TaxID=159450 RepID=UPI0039A41C67
MDSFDYSNGASNSRARPLLALRRSNGGARRRREASRKLGEAGSLRIVAPKFT